jgi:hypothetical protein
VVSFRPERRQNGTKTTVRGSGEEKHSPRLERKVYTKDGHFRYGEAYPFVAIDRVVWNQYPNLLLLLCPNSRSLTAYSASMEKSR